MEHVRNFFLRRRGPQESHQSLAATTSSGNSLCEEHDLECPICKDSMPIGTVISKLPCSHTYHPSCISSWLKIRKTCPTCRFMLGENYQLQNGETIGNRLNDDDSDNMQEMIIELRNYVRERLEREERAKERWLILANVGLVVVAAVLFFRR